MEQITESLGFSEDNFSWKQYAQSRPAYPDSFFQRVYDYHNASTTMDESDRWNLAMDVGAGDGVLSERLVQRFDCVALVEPNKEYLDVAKRRLSCTDNVTHERMMFIHSRAEDRVLPAAQAALVLMGMSIQWTDTRASIATAAHHLKPGGTLAIVFYRRPYLTGNLEVAAIWNEIWDAAVGVMMNTGQMHDFVTDRAWRLEDSGLDCIEVPSPPFRPGIQRIKINAKNSNGGHIPFAASLKYARPANSAVHEKDVEQNIDDGNDWITSKVTSAWLMKTLKSYLAGVAIFDKASEEAYIIRLEKAIQEWGGVVEAVHPVSIILATKE